MNKKALLDKLAKVVDKAASIAVQRGTPIKIKQTDILVSNAVVRKNNDGLYDIIAADKNIVYKNIPVLDVATIVAHRYSLGQLRSIEKILDIGNNYAKYCADMLHYLHCMKGAKKRKDYVSMDILEDKYQIAEYRAKRLKQDIQSFKIVK